ncbi:olfactory receptor 7G1-like [Arapaima gigas]
MPPSSIYPSFFLGILAYCLILVFNLTILLTILLNKQLHKPMYLLLINLSINDMTGATAFYPQLISSILSQDRTISRPACVVQAVVVHMYGGGSLLTLTAMAYDRYVAICNPLRYNAVMSPGCLARIIAAVWLTDVTVMGVLFSLLARFPFCHSLLPDIICTNSALTRVVCGDTSVNNYYGLFLTVFLQSIALLTVIFTYNQILLCCLRNRQSDTKNKAARTCATHLVVFVLFELTTLFTVVSYRFSSVSPVLQRAIGISTIVFPPILNPLIYGFNTKEIKSRTVNQGVEDGREDQNRDSHASPEKRRHLIEPVREHRKEVGEFEEDEHD